MINLEYLSILGEIGQVFSNTPSHYLLWLLSISFMRFNILRSTFTISCHVIFSHTFLLSGSLGSCHSPSAVFPLGDRFCLGSFVLHSSYMLLIHVQWSFLISSPYIFDSLTFNVQFFAIILTTYFPTQASYKLQICWYSKRKVFCCQQRW